MSFLEKEYIEPVNRQEEFFSGVEKRCQSVLGELQRLYRDHLLYHFASVTFLLATFIFGVHLVINHPKSLMLAAAASLFALTLFIYLFLINHWRVRKMGALEAIQKKFMEGVEEQLTTCKEPLEHHLLVAGAAFRLTTRLYHLLFKPLSLLKKGFFQKIAAVIRFSLRQPGLYFTKERLMKTSIDQHLELIKKEPTSVEAHTSLANTYIALAKLYKEPKDFESLEAFPFLKEFFSKPVMKEKSKSATALAIEELKILDDLAPNDPWVHAQLATCYHHLDLSEQEMREYEHLSLLRPADADILFRLGLLYFGLGMRAKGLKIYQKLVDLNADRAALLIEKYDLQFEQHQGAIS